MQRRHFIKTSISYAAMSGISLNAFGNLINTLPNVSVKSQTLNQNLKTTEMKKTDIQTARVKCNGKEVKIHAIQTGMCAVKRSHITNHTVHFLTPLKITLDKHFTTFFPIWVWVIEHPEGVIVIDTGENQRVMNTDYFKPAGKIVAAYNRKNIRFSVSIENEIGFQMKQLGLNPDDVKNVVLTHLHLDHTDGLYHFPKSEIIVHEKEFNNPSGNIPALYPKWFKPKLVSYRTGFIEIFNQAYPITKKEDVLLIPTNGHTLHHASVLFKTDDFDILFAGDVCYSQEQLLKNDLPGINADYSASTKTYKNILAYAKKNKLIFLPSHDNCSANRLLQKSFLFG